MAVWAHKPTMQFFNPLTGDFLNAGKVYTYEVGTTTNKATYPTLADAIAGTNPLANPIILSAYGEADIVITGPTKFYITTSADVEVDTIDNFYPENNGSIYDSNNKIILKLTATASAVNRIEIGNAATGNPPSIRADGEANIGIMFYDSNDNEILHIDSVASAVNYIKIVNAATGTGATISALGDNTNIDINFQTKGTGVVNVKGTATASAEVRLFEDTDNGTNYVGWKCPAALTTSYTLTFPTAVPNNQVMVFDSNGTGTWATN